MGPIEMDDGSTVRITQLYEHVELYSEGEPQRNSLFVLGRPPLSVVNVADDQLLIVDPPADASSRFALEGAVATLFTDAGVETDLPRVETQEGGVAHIQIGEHFLDVYGQADGAVIHLPALGILCGGGFGSDVALPRLAAGSNGDGELETLRLLAGLLKRRLQLYIPRVGAPVNDRVAALEGLADDVAYILGMQRVIPAIVARGDGAETALALGESLLPAGRRGQGALETHRRNLRSIFLAASTSA